MEALLTDSAPVGDAARPRASLRVLHGPVLTLAVGVCAALPVIAAVARGLHEGFQPVADRGIIATRSFDVLSSHMPLVGQYSFAGTVTGKLTYSLGPMLYWLLAPAAHVGAPATFVWTMGAVNVASILGAVALARRRGGIWLMVAAAVGIGLMCRSLAANNFYDIWNPSAGLFPLLLLIFVCWSLACGEYRLLPLAILVASFEAQCEDAFVPPALAALVVGLAGLLLWWLRERRARGQPSTFWRWALAAAIVSVICWTPPLIDQVDRSGNLGHVLQAAGERKSPLGGTVGLHAVIRTVGVKPWWLTRTSDFFVRKHDVRRPAGTVASLSTVLILGWLLLAIALAIRRRRPDVVAGAVLALALCGAIWSIASATPSTPHFLSETLGYTLWSATTVGMFVWLIALWAAVVLSGARMLPARAGSLLGRRAHWRPPMLRAAGAGLAATVAVALAALAGGAGAASGTPDEHAFEFPALKTINSRLGAVPRGHTVFLNARLDGLITPLRPEITYDLRRRGVRALGTGAYLRTGHWYERAEHPYDYVVWVYDNRRLPVKGARVVAVAYIQGGGRRHTVEVALSPVRPRAPASAKRPGERGARSARASTAASGWSAPSELLSGCAAAGPLLSFPSKGPTDATGPGAIVWASPARCGGAPASSEHLSLSVAALASGERASPASTRLLAVAPGAELTAAGASFGRIAVAVVGNGRRTPGGRGALLLQGRATRALSSPRPIGKGRPLALAHAYLGDVALATVRPGGAIAVRLQRYFRHAFAPPRLIPIAPGAVTALTATMDYRADVLVAWQQNGAIYAHMLRASGRADPTQRLGASAPHPQLRALVSDNDHGMVTWSSTQAPKHSAARTWVYIDLSAAGVRFRSPQVLASFPDPAHVGSRSGSLALVRLSSENVVLAWTDAERGHYVVRAAPAVSAATQPTTLLSDPSGQAVLADLAPGPAREAIAVWSAPPPGHGFDPSRSELWTARTSIEPHNRLAFRAPERITAPGPNVDARVAVDPANDRAVAAWRTQGTHAGIRYAASLGLAGYSPRRPAAALRPKVAGTHWLRIALAAIAAAAALSLAAAAMWRARRRREP